MKYRVLHVEDNPADVDLVRRQLVASTEPGFTVDSVATLARARAYLATSEVDLLLLDLGLPDSMGLEGLSQLKEYAEAPIIVLSGGVDEVLRRRAIDLGAVDVVSKSDATSPLFSRAVLFVIERRAALDRRLQIERLLDATPDGILIVDAGGVVRYLNRAAVALFGRDREDLVGERLGFSVANGEATEVVVPRGGEALVCELRVSPFEWEGVAAHLAMLRDVTTARSSQARFDRIAESGLLGIVTSDVAGRLLDANDAFLRPLGYVRADLAAGALSWSDLVADERAPARRSGVVWRAAAQDPGFAAAQSVETFELDLLRRDGSRAPHVVVVAMVDPIRRMYFTLDLSERKRAEWARVQAEMALRSTEAQLRHAQKMEAVGQLAGGIAHDFNNILSVILAHGEMLLASLPEDDPVRADVGEIHKAGERAARLTKQLLMFSRKQVLEPKVLELDEVLLSMGTMLERVLGEDIELRVTPSPKAGRIRADRGSVEQVIMNLVVNARDAMPSGGRLVIETANVELDDEHAARHAGETPGPHVMLSVSDSGVGMTPETLSHIFDPFFTTKDPGRGTGLGLSTVFGIVKQAGGSVRVHSEVGLGTTFKIYLPRTDAPLSLETQVPPGLPSGSETILLVEDEDAVRAVAARILRKLGYRVIEASNGAQALSLDSARTEHVHLLLTDVVMPQMGGLELATQLTMARPELRVLCMSGHTDDGVVRCGVHSAAISYLQKPFTPRALARKVREVLDAPSEPVALRASS